MQERSVTIAGENYKLDLFYFVLATQNPIEQKGPILYLTQLDRLCLPSSSVPFSFAEEVQVVKDFR
jgi:MoxR-like ATPase